VTDVRFVDATPFGFGWIAPEPKFMQRCSHALRVGESVWVTDPVAADGVVDRIRALGEPAGVLVLIDRHARDSERVAQELGVPRYVAPQEPPIAPFDLVPLGKERALWLPEHAALVVGEALGTVQYYRAPDERVGIHPFRRLLPPRELAAFEPEHLLFSHGEGVHGPEAVSALRETLAHGRVRTASWLWAGLKAHGPFSRRGR
jgi:hypothetical protein